MDHTISKSFVINTFGALKYHPLDTKLCRTLDKITIVWTAYYSQKKKKKTSLNKKKERFLIVYFLKI